MLFRVHLVKGGIYLGGLGFVNPKEVVAIVVATGPGFEGVEGKTVIMLPNQRHIICEETVEEVAKSVEMSDH
jgi:hypothetical protein